MAGPDHKLRQALAARARTGSLRQLSSSSGVGIDFCSNDYLGMARSKPPADAHRQDSGAGIPAHSLGSTGSRLISGNSAAAERLEDPAGRLSRGRSRPDVRQRLRGQIPACLPALPGPGDTLIMDEMTPCLQHRRRVSARRAKLVFRHNDLDDLARSTWPAAQPLSAWSRCTRWVATRRRCGNGGTGGEIRRGPGGG